MSLVQDADNLLFGVTLLHCRVLFLVFATENLILNRSVLRDQVKELANSLG
jgi:hypothetical protein